MRREYGGVIDDYRAAVKQRITEVEKHMSDGKCLDYAAYKACVGRVSGLRESLSLFNDVLKVYLTNDAD